MQNHFLKPHSNMSRNTYLSKTFVDEKLKRIIADLECLKQMLEQEPYEALVVNEAQMTRAERYLERIVNRSIDINFHLIRSAGEPPPDDYTKSFHQLGTIGAIPAKLAVEIAPSVGARNILVHEYDDLDLRLFYSSLQDAVRLFPAYVKALKKYIT